MDQRIALKSNSRDTATTPYADGLPIVSIRSRSGISLLKSRGRFLGVHLADALDGEGGEEPDRFFALDEKPLKADRHRSPVEFDLAQLDGAAAVWAEALLHSGRDPRIRLVGQPVPFDQVVTTQQEGEPEGDLVRLLRLRLRGEAVHVERLRRAREIAAAHRAEKRLHRGARRVETQPRLQGGQPLVDVRYLEGERLRSAFSILGENGKNRQHEERQTAEQDQKPQRQNCACLRGVHVPTLSLRSETKARSRRAAGLNLSVNAPRARTFRPRRMSIAREGEHGLDRRHTGATIAR